MKKLLLPLLALFMFSACNLGGGTDNAESTIKGYDKEMLNQTVNADETSKTDCIRFKALESWTANVTSVASRSGGTNVDWLRLSEYGGGAGDVVLSVTFDENKTGAPRKAKVVIKCGNNEIAIIIEQKSVSGGDEDIPDEEQKVSGIVERIIESWNEYDEQVSLITEFKYNEDKTIKEWTMYYDDNLNGVVDANEAVRESAVVTYPEKNKVVVVWTETYDGKKEAVITSTLELNGDGHVVAAKYVIQENGQTKTTNYKMSYLNGYISSGNDGNGYEETMSWTGDNLTKVNVSMRGGEQTAHSEAVYSNINNKPEVNIDLNYFIAQTEWYACLGENGNYGMKLFGFFGKRSRNMLGEEYEYEGNENKRGYKFGYEIDPKSGFITEMKAFVIKTSSDSGEIATYKIIYKK